MKPKYLKFHDLCPSHHVHIVIASPPFFDGSPVNTLPARWDLPVVVVSDDMRDRLIRRIDSFDRIPTHLRWELCQMAKEIEKTHA